MHVEARLTLLGGFTLHVGDSEVRLALCAQRLLAFLAVNDRALSRSQVAGTLWSSMSESRATANLRTTLWRLRHPRLTLVRAGRVELSLGSDVHVDFREVAALARSVSVASAAPGSFLVEPCHLSGPLLPGWDDDWVVMERERVEQLRLHALESLCEGFTAVGRYAEAVEAGLAAVHAEPLRETAHAVLIAAYVAEGNRARALRQFELYRRMLWDELRLRPSPPLQRLVGDLGPEPPESVRELEGQARLPRLYT